MPNRRHSDGFTLIEMAIVLAVVSMIMLIGLPALLNTIARSNLTTTVRETAALMRAARFDAVRHNTTTRVFTDPGTRQVVAFTDFNDDCILNGTDTVIGTFAVPRGVQMAGPGGVSFAGFQDMGSGKGCAKFLSSGSADVEGSFYFQGQGGDTFDAHIEPAATGRVSVRKEFTDGWFRNGEDGHNWWS
jgi:prepilin-type N-terminal cleavage/methylation domain-containing protein